MPFGKFKGSELDELPDDYLAWLCGIELRPPLRNAVIEEAERRRAADTDDTEAVFALACPDPRLAEALVDAGYRSLARRHHPDVGGSHDAFLDLQRVNEWLRSIVRSVA